MNMMGTLIMQVAFIMFVLQCVFCYTIQSNVSFLSTIQTFRCLACISDRFYTPRHLACESIFTKILLILSRIFYIVVSHPFVQFFFPLLKKYAFHLITVGLIQSKCEQREQYIIHCIIFSLYRINIALVTGVEQHQSVSIRDVWVDVAFTY